MGIHKYDGKGDNDVCCKCLYWNDTKAFDATDHTTVSWCELHRYHTEAQDTCEDGCSQERLQTMLETMDQALGWIFNPAEKGVERHVDG